MSATSALLETGHPTVPQTEKIVQKRQMERLPFVLLLSGLIALVLSVILGWVLVPNYIHNQIQQQVRLENGTTTYSKWKDITVPIFISIRLFNVTNADDVGTQGHKPVLAELGPYIYQQKRVKTDIEFDLDQDTVSSRQFVTYHFRPDMSNGTEDDMITTLNLPILGIGKMAQKANHFVKVMLNMYAGRYAETPFVTKKVGEILFDGYYVPMIDNLQNVTRKAILPNSTFGYYYGKNGTDDGVYEIRAGKKEPSRFGEIVSWNEKSDLNWWGTSGGGDYCNKINGSDGSIFPAFVKKDRVVRIFSSDLCRSLYLTYEDESEVKGIPGLRFAVPKSMLADPVTNQDNRCFCTTPDPVENCPKAGVIMLSACRNGAPIVASTPHFLDGDEMYLNQSVGLSPDRTLHETFLNLEPNTGLVLEGRKRIQINVDTSGSHGLDILKNLPNQLFPIFWVEESATVTDETVEALESKLLFSINALNIGKWVFVIFSCFLTILGVTIFCLRTRRKQRLYL